MANLLEMRLQISPGHVVLAQLRKVVWYISTADILFWDDEGIQVQA